MYEISNIKINYNPKHYKEGLKNKFSNKEKTEIEEMAKQNLNSIGGVYLYEKIISNLNFLKSKESLAVLDQTLEQVNKNNLTFVDGFLYFTQAQVEKKKQNLIQHSVKVQDFLV